MASIYSARFRTIEGYGCLFLTPQKRFLNGILIRERIHADPYPVMPIFSRPYLLASRDVVTEVGCR